MSSAKTAESSTRTPEQHGPRRPDSDSLAPRALIADPDALARNALRGALAQAGVVVVGQAADAPQAINLVQRCRPDVVVMDAGLPPDGAMAALEAVVRASPGVQVVVLAASGEDEAGLLALEKGAAGYLSRDTELASLAQAVVRVAAGEAAISRVMTSRVVERLRSCSTSMLGMRPIKSPLTTREWEVLDLMKAGASTGEIARALVLSPDTVHSHVTHILRKLNAHSRAEAVGIAQHARQRLVEAVQ